VPFNNISNLFGCEFSVIFKEQLSVLFDRRILKLSQIQLDVLLPNVYCGRLFFWSDRSTHFYLEDDVFLIGTFDRTYLIFASAFVLSIVYDKNESSRRVW